MSGVTPFFHMESYPLDIQSSHHIASASSVFLLGAVASLVAATPAAATPSFYDAPRIVLYSGATSTNGYLTDLFRRAAYVNVHNVIETMAAIPVDEDYHIDEATAEGAHFALSLLYIMGIAVPKVFSHDSESVTFSWARGSDRQYITVSEGVASLLRTSSTKSEILEHSSLHEPSIVGLLKMAGEYGGGTEFVRQQ
ncbi:hypothetical protein [Mesorhizobium sp. B1-1-8]|uniref:hypothetical protein n=1 Tax=Mesorhizobium sp. B1-1-8 TaxID=2589976 RepID=UPI001126B1B6|nr:hypothetical protein [Mesorhizobium sp. B1-1-8]UCI06280.1 hypothetical protein FJ974_21025 [Mesorhizobium sp. B1-1-8]